MKARLPKGMGGGPQNMQSMLRQAQKIQDGREERTNPQEFRAQKIQYNRP